MPALMLVAGLLAAGGARADAPPPDLGARVVRSLVKVAAVCGNSLRIGSGFVWGEQHQVVTDLHVVVGCSPITVLYFVPETGATTQGGTTQGGTTQVGQTQREATVTRWLREADLALLTVQDPPDAPPLRVAAQPPAAEDPVVAFGFPLGIQAPVDTRLQVTFANNLFPQLDSTLDDAARAELQKLQFPALTSEVLHLSGPLEPGDSGAPVVNMAGELVGIGSGGLQQGAASISWAMRARYLPLLAISTDEPPPGGEAGSLFAVVTQPVAAPRPPPPGVQCGAKTLSFRGTRTLADLVGTLKDTVATGGTAMPSAMLAEIVRDPAMAASAFDIWVAPDSGAAAVVPQGAALVPGKNFCRVAVGPDVRLLIRLEPLPADPATPEWALAVAQRKFQALALYSKEIKDKVFPAQDLIDWDADTVANGALVTRAVQKAGRGDARIYRADLDGRGVSLAEAAVIDVAEDQAPAAVKQALTRALTAAGLAAFAPLDRTQQGQAPAVVPDNGEGGPGRPLYAWMRCGLQFQLMSAVPTFGALVAKRPDAAALAAVVQQAAGISVDSIAQAQYDVWAQTPSGIATLVLRGLQVVRDKLFGDACLFRSLTDPNLAAAVIGRRTREMAEVPAMQDALATALRANIGALQPLPSAVPNVTVWQATGTRYGQQVRVVMSLQRRGEWMVVFGFSAADIVGLNRRLATSYGGVLLAPGVTDSLNR